MVTINTGALWALFIFIFKCLMQTYYSLKNHFTLWDSLGSFVNVYVKQFQFRKIFYRCGIPKE